MKVLILGGTGLISTAIAREFLSRGVDLTLYNRGQRPSRLPPGATVVHGDRDDAPSFGRQMAELGPFDCVIDMICFRPDQAAATLRACAGRTGQLIFCSTVDVYNKPAHHYPILESEPLRGDNDYGRNKVRCEELLMAAHARGDLPVTIIRPAMTYGEGGTLVNIYGWGTYHLDRMRRGKPLIVHGDGSSLWVACHIDDAAQAFANVAGNPATLGRAYHVTGEEWMTWDQYYARMAEALGVPLPPLVHIPTDLLARLAPQRALYTLTNFQGNNIFDNSAAHADLGFRYTIPFVEGARRTIAWLDAHGRIDGSDDGFDDPILAQWERLTRALVEALPEIDQPA
jgi:nucleoside-diphosphate-sugar epimerase